MNLRSETLGERERESTVSTETFGEGFAVLSREPVARRVEEERLDKRRSHSPCPTERKSLLIPLISRRVSFLYFFFGPLRASIISPGTRAGVLSTVLREESTDLNYNSGLSIFDITVVPHRDMRSLQ